MDLRNTGKQSSGHGRPGESNVLVDRRRPGRMNDINPALYDLLLGNQVDGTELSSLIAKDRSNTFAGGDLVEDNLREARGVLSALIISVMIWALIFGFLAFVFDIFNSSEMAIIRRSGERMTVTPWC